MAKKVLLANAAGRAVDMLLAENTKFTVLGSWLGIVFFAFQIYFDFSGYSDMAIGLGRMIGFEFKENFNYPYVSATITDFWRRWHISLSTFFRDYVYIPLGGNRKRQLRNLFTVWFLTGLWHGAGWNFILWGLFYAALLAAEKSILRHVLKFIGILSHLYALFIILIGWAIFYFTDTRRLSEWFAAAFGKAELIDFRTESVFFSNIFLLIALAAASTPLPVNVLNKVRQKIPALEPMANILLLGLSFVMLVGQSYNPFLYFRF